MRRQRPRHAPRGQRGIAMLVAILLVALGTIIAAAVAYENATTVRRGTATYAFDQALLIAQGAEALAAYGLRQIRQNDQSHTYPGQGWGKPLGPIEVVPGVMLEASLEDLQGRFNLNNLVKNDTTPDPVQLQAFIQLLAMSGLETKWAGYIVDWIDGNIAPSIPDGAEDSVYMGQTPPYRTANRYITSTSELLALPGFGRDRYLKLAPYVSALPFGTPVNVCTAPGLVLDAYLGHADFSSDPDSLAKNRANASACFPTQTDYEAAFADPKRLAQVRPKIAQLSSYFRLTSFITIGSAEFNLYSLLYQDQNGGGAVRPILRSFTPD
ncbi:MAG TPA: type II secretion system minor pseudopilin GspK [Steroidobacteraceae bacterium]|nr:type II secretion system minor pseudopilin GspK [Steroidobacteraceae bacterium]